MFTGIIETTGQILALEREGDNLIFRIQSEISGQLKVDQSVSHNGVCLTVTGVEDDTHKVTAISETLMKSNLGTLKAGDMINLERSLKADGRLDGHFVQGHVDQVAKCVDREELSGSWVFSFEYLPTSGNITVEKGSICVNGVSLTVFDSHKNKFSVAIIPYTFGHTNFKYLKTGDEVNLEFDIIGKYIQRLMELKE